MGRAISKSGLVENVGLAVDIALLKLKVKVDIFIVAYIAVTSDSHCGGDSHCYY